MATPSRKDRERDKGAKEAKEEKRDGAPLSNVTNQATATSTPARALAQGVPHIDTLASQISSLTSIAQCLQKEISSLSRRSRDNATDLMSLKEATSARDEDIRKSLRELMHTMHDTSRPSARDPYGGPFHGDGRSGMPQSPSKSGKPFTLPRIPSPSSFAVAMDRDSLLSTPSLVADGPSSALLEHVLQEMATKDGQDALIARLEKIAKTLAGLASGAKVQELVELIKVHQQETTTLIAEAGGSGGGIGSGRPCHYPASPEDENPRGREHHLLPVASQNERTSSAPPTRASDLLNDDLIKIIRTVKDSVAQGGGLTAEVKALVRELRGEVLGMGRELGRRLDEVSSKTMDKDEVANRDEMEQVVKEGLSQLKKHMNELLREHRRQSAADAKARGPPFNYQEVHKAMRSAMKDAERENDQLSRKDILDAVKDAWDNYKPDITVEQVGLERDEVLACLREGMAQCMPRNPRDDDPPGATREQVFDAVVDGLKHFSPPKIETPASISRHDVLEVVRECLEDFEFPVPPPDIRKSDVLDAVKEGLNSFDFPSTSNALVPQSGTPPAGEVVERLDEILEVMRMEFKAVSKEAKRNVAENGRDTETVLDATKDGFAQLRADMEIYLDRAAGSAGHEDSIHALTKTLDSFRDDVGELIDKSSKQSKEMLREELESLHDAVNSSLVPHTPQINTKEILATLHESLGSLREALEHVRTEVIRPKPASTELLNAIQEGFNDVRASIDKIGEKPPDLSANDEILDALKEGLDHVRSDIDVVREQTQNQNDKAVTPFTGEAPGHATDQSMAVVAADFVKGEDIKNLEQIIHDLTVKIEAMDNGTASTRPPPPTAEGASKEQIDRLEELIKQPDESAKKEDIDRLEEVLRTVKEAVTRSPETKVNAAATAAIETKDNACQSRAEQKKGSQDIKLEGVATREDAHAIETLLHNTKARIDDLVEGEQAVRRDHIDNIEALVLETKQNMGVLNKEDLEPLETLMLETKGEMSRVKKDDLDALGAVISETKEQLATITNEIKDVSRQKDISMLEAVVGQVHASFEELKEREEAQLADPERVTKTMIQALESHCMDIKGVLDSMVRTDLATVSTKEDINPLRDAVKDLQDKAAALADVNAKSFEERKAEIVGLGERVTEVKVFLEEFQTLVKTKIDEGATGIDGLSEVLHTLSSTINANASVGADITTLSEAMKAEFEDNRATFVGAKLESDEKFQETIESIKSSIDEKVGEVLVKHEEFQGQMEKLEKIGDERDDKIEKSVVSIKTIAEEVKILVDALGSTVTDSLEKMEEASKTVFGRVEDLVCKTGETNEENKIEHAHTREEVKEAIKSIEALQASAGEFRPQVLQIVKDVLLLVGEHFDYSKASVDDLKQHVVDNKPKPSPPFPIDEVKYDDTAVNEKLDQLVTRATAADESWACRDSQVNEKLDKIVGYQATSHAAYGRLETLDKVHAQVVATAADVTTLLEGQKQRICKENEDREKALKETNLTIERRTAEKEAVEAILADLREQVAKLKDEEKQARDSMVAAKSFKDEEDLIRAEMLRQVKEEVEQLKDEEAKTRDSIRASATCREEDSKLRSETIAHMRRQVDLLKAEEETLRQNMKRAAAIQEEETAAHASMLASLKEEEERVRQSLRKAAAMRDEEDMLRLNMLAALKAEEEKLQANVTRLGDQNEQLLKKKFRLVTDVGSLETALHLRREDLAAMEQRAQTLERRILDGVLDHSRVLLMAKNGFKQKENKESTRSGPRKRVSNANNLKRLGQDQDQPSQSSSSGGKRQSAAKNNPLNMAVNRSLASNSPAGSRRILSLTQISQNVPTGSLGRSQSVRDSVKGRKSSWGGRASTSSDTKRESLRDSLPPLGACASRTVSLSVKGSTIDEEVDKENASAHVEETSSDIGEVDERSLHEEHLEHFDEYTQIMHSQEESELGDEDENDEKEALEDDEGDTSTLRRQSGVGDYDDVHTGAEESDEEESDDDDGPEEEARVEASVAGTAESRRASEANVATQSEVDEEGYEEEEEEYEEEDEEDEEDEEEGGDDDEEEEEEESEKEEESEVMGDVRRNEVPVASAAA